MLTAVSATPLWALDGAADGQSPTLAVTDERDGQVVAYPAEFFDRYQPRTVLDMVQRLPGFNPDDGDATRGFGGAAGNILINDRRPSAKQDRPTEILGRIPPSHVERIDLIRGSVSGIDLRGHSMLANVVLRPDAPAAIRWEASLRKDFRAGPLSPSASISRADRWRGVQYNAGLLARRRGGLVQGGTERLLDGDDALLERRLEESIDITRDLAANLNASRWWGDTFVQLNAEAAYDSSDGTEDSHRFPLTGAGRDPRTEIFADGFDRWRFELGADAERVIGSDLVATGIGLFILEDRDGFSAQRRLDAAGAQLLARDADNHSEAIESIARLELAWAGIENHLIQLNLEGAYNALDNALEVFVDAGDGPVEFVIPGANTRVEEVRGDILLNDNLDLGRADLEFGLGAETSTISQSGDARRSRSFFFVKPRAAFTWAPDERRQTRMRVAREVSQLDFNDFVSATNFADDDLALGNPELRPETTWLAELTHERRFGDIGVVRMTAFHHWISEVEDLLPLTEQFEVPGNIGSGRRWGVDLRTTVGLDALRISDARLDLAASWQDSRVTDPVTGRSRVLSDEREYDVTLEYRQDLEAQAMAWGLDVGLSAERPLYKVNELDVFDDRFEVNGFIETSRWLNLRLRLEAEHIFNTRLLRDRQVFAGRRELSAVDFRELRERKRGRRVTLSLSGTF